MDQLRISCHADVMTDYKNIQCPIKEGNYVYISWHVKQWLRRDKKEPFHSFSPVLHGQLVLTACSGVPSITLQIIPHQAGSAAACQTPWHSMTYSYVSAKIDLQNCMQLQNTLIKFSLETSSSNLRLHSLFTL